MSRVLTLGESMGLLRGEGAGGFDQVASARVDTGGAEANTAIGLARLGVAVTWLGRIGDDGLGTRIVKDLRSEAVDVVAVTDETRPTGLMLKSQPRPGTTIVDYYRRGSAGSALRPEDLDLVDLDALALLHVTGVTLALSESARATVLAAIARAKDAGALVSFAVNHRRRLWHADEARPVYEDILRDVDIVFASDDEARMLRPGVATDALAAMLADAGPDEAIVTCGGDGAFAHIDGSAHRVAAERIAPVDTVGAGDAFAAGYLAERLAGARPERRLLVAARAGAYACLHEGDWQGAPRRSEIDHPVSAGQVVR